MIHRISLVLKSLTPDMLIAMNQVIHAVNFIKSQSLRFRIFSRLCDIMGLDYKTLLYHTDVLWFSKGKVLKRLIHLKAEAILYLEVKKKTFIA